MLIKYITVLIILIALALCHVGMGMIEVTWTWKKELIYYALSFVFSTLLGYSFFTYVTMIKTRGYSPKNLCKNLNEKVWMTIGLGVSFAGIYLLINFFGHYLFKADSFTQLLQYGLNNPAFFFKGACVFLVVNAMLVYFIRIAVKFLYLKNL